MPKLEDFIVEADRLKEILEDNIDRIPCCIKEDGTYDLTHSFSIKTYSHEYFDEKYADCFNFHPSLIKKFLESGIAGDEKIYKDIRYKFDFSSNADYDWHIFKYMKEIIDSRDDDLSYIEKTTLSWDEMMRIQKIIKSDNLEKSPTSTGKNHLSSESDSADDNYSDVQSLSERRKVVDPDNPFSVLAELDF